MLSERSRFRTPSALLCAAPRRRGAKFVIASYPQPSHASTGASALEEAGATVVREGAETGPTAIAEPVLLSIETALDKPSILSAGPALRERRAAVPAAKACPARAAARRPYAARSLARSSRRRRADRKSTRLNSSHAN